jgi:hypothetical protein
VRQYLAGAQNDPPHRHIITLPEIETQFPTYGPHNRYGAILYIEKEGFLPLLQRAGFAERYDLAIMSSKGMGTTAVRTLIEELSDTVSILVLHDFDKSGFSIVGTLTRDTRRYTYTTEPNVIDLGLRLTDISNWGLQSEDVIHNGDPTDNLVLNGATPAEVDFLRGEPTHGNRYRGRRVELNAFTSAQFVEWLESKLIQHQIGKVIPDTATLEEAYRHAIGIRKCRATLQSTLREVERLAATLKVPRSLSSRIQKQLTLSPTMSWDEAVEGLLPVDSGIDQ